MEHRKEIVSRMEDIMPLIREALNMGQSVRFNPRGISMLPMLREGIDSVVLSPLPEKLHKYDLPLYQRKNGKYVLHRVVKVEGSYTCVGDNQFVVEQGLEHDQMIALVTAFYRGDKKYNVTDLRYRLYCRIWHFGRPLRHFCRRGIRWVRRHLI